MNNRLFSLMILLALGMSLISCRSTMPSASDMDRFQQKAEQMAQQQIVLLDAQKARGEISSEMHEAKVAAIKEGIPKKTSELAWAQHELAESHKRALGIPTGDMAQAVSVPKTGGQDSFYRPYGQTNNSNSVSPSMQMQQRGYVQGFADDGLGPR
ncbi:MAG: hypothetical protein RL693_293 [Verrucomicrobiota bacterium]|jgi:hypothetical protein